MTAITFTLPFIPKSLKNNKGIRRGRFYKPATISREQIAMRAAVLDAMTHADIKRPRDKAFFGDDDVAVETVDDVYVNQYGQDPSRYQDLSPSDMAQHDGYLSVGIDGDHSGDDLYFSYSSEFDKNMRHAQE